MFTLQFQATDIEELIYKKYKHPQLLVQKRMEVIHLISMGIDNYGLVAHIAGVHRDTVTDYVKLYNSASLAGLEKLNYWAKKSDLAAHAAQVKAHFEAQPALNLAEAKAKIETLTGIKRQPSQIRHFLHQLGIRYRKIGQIPALPTSGFFSPDS
jgi:transposase